jgi:hypothetical protein
MSFSYAYGEAAYFLTCGSLQGCHLGASAEYASSMGNAEAGA